MELPETVVEAFGDDAFRYADSIATTFSLTVAINASIYENQFQTARCPSADFQNDAGNILSLHLRNMK